MKTIPRKLLSTSLLFLGVCLFCISYGCPVGSAQTPSGSPSGTPSVAPDYRQQAGMGTKALQQWYLPSTGLYAAPTGWWNAANSITALANYERITGSTVYNSVLANTFRAAQSAHPDFLNSYYDDDGWWALAWIDAYDLTGNTEYLQMAETIFTTMTRGWDSVCGGGLWWSTAKKYKNAIPNELFLTIAAKLANRTSGRASADYLKWAGREWTWFKGTGMINAQNLINDGLTSTNPNSCTNNGKTIWSYNQGVILDGLVELSHADHNSALLTQAGAIANAAISSLTTGEGVLNDKSVTGGDAPQFKGIFLRNLMALYAAAPNPGYKAFAEANANSILAHDQSQGSQFGGLWQGPFDSADATRQTSALDALIAAAAM